MESKENKGKGDFKMLGDWKMQSDKLKVRFPALTDSDLKFETGRENDLLERVESRLNKNRDEVIGIIRKEQPTTL